MGGSFLGCIALKIVVGWIRSSSTYESASPSLPYSSSISEISRSCVRAMLGLAQNDIISSVGSKSSTSHGTEKSLNASKQSNVLSSMSTVCRHTRLRGLNCVPRSSANTSPGHHSSTHGPLHRIHKTSHIHCVLGRGHRMSQRKKHAHMSKMMPKSNLVVPLAAPITPLAKRSCKSEMREIRKCVQAP